MYRWVRKLYADDRKSAWNVAFVDVSKVGGSLLELGQGHQSKVGLSSDTEFIAMSGGRYELGPIIEMPHE